MAASLIVKFCQTTANTWQNAPMLNTLTANSVHLWHLYLAPERFPPAHYWSSLSSDEQQRAQKFINEPLRTRFILARGLLRFLLSTYLQESPQRLQFAYTDKGKPYLPAAAHLHFNLSHSQNQALYAIARHPVGVDIECLRDQLRYEQLTRLVLSEQEQASWENRPPAERQRSFFRVWTRKEALLKAGGKGLAGNMRQLTVPLSAYTVALHHYFTPIDPHPWALYDVKLPEQAKAVACLVCAKIPDTLVYKVLKNP